MFNNFITHYQNHNPVYISDEIITNLKFTILSKGELLYSIPNKIYLKQRGDICLMHYKILAFNIIFNIENNIINLYVNDSNYNIIKHYVGMFIKILKDEFPNKDIYTHSLLPCAFNYMFHKKNICYK